MGDDLIVFGKAVLSVIAVLVALMLFRWERFYRLSNRDFIFLAVGVLALSRVAVYILLYFVLHVSVPSDVPSYYVPQGHAVLQGLMAYRDFYSSYAPGFGYIVAGILSVWDSPKAIVLFTLITEILAIPIWISSARYVFPENRVRYAFLLYGANSLPLVISSIAGQNQLWMNLLLAVSWLLVVKKMPFSSGVAMGFSMVVIKILGLIFAPTVWLICSAKYRWLAGFFIPLVAYLLLAVNGVDIFVPIRGEVNNIFSGNLPYVMACLKLDFLTRHSVVVLVGVLVSLFIYIYIKFPVKSYRLGWYATTLVAMLFMLLSKKSPTNYLSMFLFIPAAAMAMTSFGWKGIVSFGVFGLIATLEPTLWFRWADHSYVNVYGLFDGTMPAEQMGKTIVFLVFEVLLMAYYVKYVIASWLSLTNCKEAANSLHYGAPAP